MKTPKEKQRILDKRTALLKAESWCAYQERSQQEARDKLYGYGLHQQEVEELLGELIVANFLNEERFAMAYVLGKVNIKKWGRLKIRQGLKQKQVPDKLIQKVLKNIDGDVYLDNLTSVALKKSAMLTERNAVKRKYQLVNYLLGRGYEQDLIFDVLKANNLT